MVKIWRCPLKLGVRYHWHRPASCLLTSSIAARSQKFNPNPAIHAMQRKCTPFNSIWLGLWICIALGFVSRKSETAQIEQIVVVENCHCTLLIGISKEVPTNKMQMIVFSLNLLVLLCGLALAGLGVWLVAEEHFYLGTGNSTIQNPPDLPSDHHHYC